jgi:hypothetical protein
MIDDRRLQIWIMGAHGRHFKKSAIFDQQSSILPRLRFAETKLQFSHA